MLGTVAGGWGATRIGALGTFAAAVVGRVKINASIASASCLLAAAKAPRRSVRRPSHCGCSGGFLALATGAFSVIRAVSLALAMFDSLRLC
jgi:hypothetical protein